MGVRSIINKTADFEDILLTYCTHSYYDRNLALSRYLQHLHCPPKVYGDQEGQRYPGWWCGNHFTKKYLIFAILDCSLSETLCCRISFSNITFLIIATYRVADASIKFLDDLDAILCNYVKARTRVILAGDFKLSNINWENLNVGKHCE